MFSSIFFFKAPECSRALLCCAKATQQRKCSSHSSESAGPPFLCICSTSSTWTQILGAWSFGLLAISEWTLWSKTRAGRNYCFHVLFSLNSRHSWVIWSLLLIYLYNFFNSQECVLFSHLNELMVEGVPKLCLCLTWGLFMGLCLPWGWKHRSRIEVYDRVYLQGKAATSK